ncbi:hypothetical protein HMI55_005642 [Coelomomyces lativittatus]|nr:hypothetical protein HMI55_005642 [Coelomomyces lativittatus]
MLEGLEIPLQLHGFFDYKHFKNGKLLIELHDHRLGMDQAPETLTLHMSPSQVCLYQDFLTLVQQLKKDGSDKTLHEVEARYLVCP